MTTDRQKQDEVLYAKEAADKLGEVWDIKPAPNEEDWPDLIVSTRSGKFGLEIREIYLDESRKGSPKKAQETRNENKLGSIVDAYYTTNKSPIRVVFFGNINNKNKIVARLIQEESKLSEFETKSIIPYPGCKAHLRKLPTEFGKYTKWDYGTDQVGYVGTITSNWIEKHVAKKALNLPKYSKNISNIRLLLVSNGIKNSGKAKLNDNSKCDPCGFEMVYYFSYPMNIQKINS